MARKLKLNGCPRCGGTMSREGDYHGDYYSCIQCGHIEEVKKEKVSGRR